MNNKLMMGKLIQNIVFFHTKENINNTILRYNDKKKNKCQKVLELYNNSHKY